MSLGSDYNRSKAEPHFISHITDKRYFLNHNFKKWRIPTTNWSFLFYQGFDKFTRYIVVVFKVHLWFGSIVHFSIVEYHVVKSHFEFQFAEWYFNHYAHYCSNMARHSYLHKHYLFITIYFNQRFLYFTQVLLNKLPVLYKIIHGM